MKKYSYLFFIFLITTSFAFPKPIDFAPFSSLQNYFQKQTVKTWDREGIKPGSPEIPSLRAWNAKAFDNGDGTSQWIVHGRPLHYQKGRQWVDIDTRFERASWWTFFDYQAIKNNYQTYVKNNFMAEDLVVSGKGRSQISMTPISLQWVRLGEEGSALQLEKVQDFVKSDRSIGYPLNWDQKGALTPSGIMNWDDAFGEGLHFRIQPQVTRLLKWVEVQKKEDLFGVRDEFAVNSDYLSFEIDFKTKLKPVFPEGFHVSNQHYQICSAIPFRDKKGKTIATLKNIQAMDSERQIVFGKMAVKQISQKTGYNHLRVAVFFEKEKLENLSYPIQIDPDTVYVETTDGHIYGQDSTYATARSTANQNGAAAAQIWIAQITNPAGYYVNRGFIEFDTSVVSG